MILTIYSLFADIKPIKDIKINGAVLDMVVVGDNVYVATDKSKVIVYDLNLKMLQEIKVRKIKDFVGELIDSDIYSVDVIDKKVLLLAQAEDGYSELFIYKDGKLEKVLDKSLMFYAKAAKFADKENVIMALMSDEVVLYNIRDKKVVYKKSAGEYFFSAMAINKARTKVVIGDEGGEVIVIDTKTGDVIKKFVDINKDKILSLSINQDFVAAGSRDKTLVVYNLNFGTNKKIKGDFFVYVASISPSSSLIAYGDNEKYDIKVIDSTNLDRKFLLKGHKNIINKIVFINDNILFSGSESGEIKKWRLK